MARVFLVTILCLIPLHKCAEEVGPMPCPETLSIDIPEGEYILAENGELVHRDMSYPPGSHWHDFNGTRRACFCQVTSKPCLRKCCAPGEQLPLEPSREHLCEPESVASDGTTMKLDPNKTSSNMRDRLSGKPALSDWFTLFKSSSDVCPKDYVFYILTPELYHEDAHELQENGSLHNAGLGLLSADIFCVDKQAGRKGLTVLTCVEKEKHSAQDDGAETPTALRIGYLTSIPFLAITFIVYAIIPELRNIYGKTLMCYVLALLSAYSSIVISSHILFSIECHILDKPSSKNCAENELFDSCGPICEKNCDDINNEGRTDKGCTEKSDCIERCACKEGHVRDTRDGKCIRIQECPRVKH